MRKPRIVIAGTNSGAGKTTVTLGIMAALRRSNTVVQGFKVGPDYIDPSYHTTVTGRPSRNLDTWMTTPDIMREIFHRGSERADISVIEGVMGMYDGKDPLSNAGSTAQVSELLQAPVILVVNAASMARSAAAIVLGFARMDPNVHIAGVIVNRVGSQRHYELVKAAIEQVTGVPAIGYLTKQDDLQIPERHLGLIPALERGELDGLFETLAGAIEATVNLEQILEIAQGAPAAPAPAAALFAGQKCEEVVTVAVARDQAFNFYYPENLELLEWHGARIVTFSPLAGEPIPHDVHGVYIGGGFPEEFAATLSRQTEVRDSLQRSVEEGMPVFAECGGYMYLTKAITDRHGAVHPMCGIIPASVAMQSRLAALGYREVTAKQDNILLPAGTCARGHEFHYSTTACDEDGDFSYAYETVGLRGAKVEGYARGNLLAGYTHLHFASNPCMAKRFVEVCRLFKESQMNLTKLEDERV